MKMLIMLIGLLLANVARAKTIVSCKASIGVHNLQRGLRTKQRAEDYCRYIAERWPVLEEKDLSDYCITKEYREGENSYRWQAEILYKLEQIDEVSQDRVWDKIAKFFWRNGYGNKQTVIKVYLPANCTESEQ